MQMTSPSVKHVNFRRVTSRTARGLEMERKSHDWARNLTNSALGSATFFIFTMLPSSSFKMLRMSYLFFVCLCVFMYECMKRERGVM